MCRCSSATLIWQAEAMLNTTLEPATQRITRAIDICVGVFIQRYDLHGLVSLHNK